MSTLAVRKVKNATATAAVTACFLIAMVPLAWLLWTVISKGWRQVASASWWTQTQRSKTPGDPGGGMLHALVGTLEQVALCTAISVPIALCVGIYLVEYGRGAFARVTTFMVDILTGIPSIVAALFIYALFISTFHQVRSGWLVSLALVILMVPVIVRTTEEMLKLVPDELREASYALGVPKWKTIVHVVLPTAFTGLVTGVVLGIARVAGETAPLLILVGYAQAINFDMFNGFMGSLPGMMYDQTSAGAGANPVPTDRLWGAALTLIVLIALLNVAARFVAKFFAPKTV